MLGASDEAEFKAIGGKKIKGVGLGNIFSEGPIKLRSTNNKQPSTKPQPKPNKVTFNHTSTLG